MKAVVTFDTDVQEVSYADELKGKLASDPDEERLMRSVLESDEQTIQEGKLILEAMNSGIQSFTPNNLFEQLVSNYKQAERLYGKGFLREAAGYEPDYIEKNIKIPEFRKELRSRIDERYKQAQEDKILDAEGAPTTQAITLAAIVLYTEELDAILPKGIGREKIAKKKDIYGIKEEVKAFAKERYRDVAVRKSIRKAVKRGHGRVAREDLVSFQRESKGKRYIIYALDSSGSMKGQKLGKSKRAGVALAFKAIEDNNRAGLVVFDETIGVKVPPTNEFPRLLKEIIRVRASQRTDIANTIREAIDLFPKEEATKHIIMITDAMPTSGTSPERKTLEAVFEAQQRGITISVIGIKLDKKGRNLGMKIAELGKGKLYGVAEQDDLNQIVLQDYASLEE